MKRILCILLCAVLLLSCVASCGARTERVSSEELTKLRENYPYMTYTSSTTPAWLDLNGLRESDSWQVKALVVYEPTGEFTQDRASLEDIVPGISEEYPWYEENMFLPAKVEKVLWSADGVTVPDEVVLNFGQSGLFGDVHADEAILNGNRYVGLLLEYTHGQSLEPEFDHMSGVFSARHYYSYWLTPDDVVLSIDDAEWLDQFSGMYLPAFQEAFTALLENQK